MVPTVSYWPASVAAEVLLVSKLARGCVLCAKKFALRTKYGPKLAFCGVLGEFFAKTPLDGSRWANFFAPVVAKVVILTDFRRKEAFFE